jgi:hypothetical protein
MRQYTELLFPQAKRFDDRRSIATAAGRTAKPLSIAWDKSANAGSRQDAAITPD